MNGARAIIWVKGGKSGGRKGIIGRIGYEWRF